MPPRARANPGSAKFGVWQQIIDRVVATNGIWLAVNRVGARTTFPPDRPYSACPFKAPGDTTSGVSDRLSNFGTGALLAFEPLAGSSHSLVGNSMTASSS